MTEYGKNDEDKQIVDKRIEYCKYIDDHIDGVKRAFQELFVDKHPIIPGYEKWELSIMEALEKRINKHDASKYQDEEFEPYRRHFYPTDAEKAKGETPEDVKLFEDAWRHHYTHNPHHPEYWRWVKIIKRGDFNTPRVCRILNTPNEVPIDMDIISILEMLCDWRSMDYKFGGTSIDFWHNKAKDERAAMSDGTIAKVDELMDILYGD